MTELLELTQSAEIGLNTALCVTFSLEFFFVSFIIIYDSIFLFYSESQGSEILL